MLKLNSLVLNWVGLIHILMNLPYGERFDDDFLHIHETYNHKLLLNLMDTECILVLG